MSPNMLTHPCEQFDMKGFEYLKVNKRNTQRKIQILMCDVKENNEVFSHVSKFHRFWLEYKIDMKFGVSKQKDNTWKWKESKRSFQ